MKVSWTNLIREIHYCGLDLDKVTITDEEFDQIEDILQGVIDTIKSERGV